MNFLYAASLTFIAMSLVPAAFADSMKCKVLEGLEENETGELKAEYNQVGADRWTTSTVDLAVGSAEESTIRLFDSMTRAGYKVTYCNPNDNEYSKFSRTASLYSICTAKAPITKIMFHSSLSKPKKGFLKYDVFYESGELITKEIKVDNCE